MDLGGGWKRGGEGARGKTGREELLAVDGVLEVSTGSSSEEEEEELDMRSALD